MDHVFPRGDEQIRMLGAPDAPAVLLLHPWWGVTPAVEEWADELVRVGRRVLLPDLYAGKVADTVAEAEALADALDHAAADRLLERCADELSAEGRPWAAMGWSLGAFLVCGLAGRGSSGPQELVLLYGGRPPAGDVERTRRVVLHVVPSDEWFTDDERAEVERGFEDAGCEVVTHRYEGCGHWFAERGSPAFDEEAFALARARVVAQLRVEPPDQP